MKSITIALILSLGLIVEKSAAQVIPDGTVGTTVSPMNVIDGGTRSGNNLFHSFSQFSIPTGSSAIFNNAPDVQTIFSRVTGQNSSNIDGLIQAQGGASLFLMNPNGIVFGPNSKLAIGGSFVGTTASSIQFADGVKFDVKDLSTNPLLTVSVPIGLQLGQTPGAISVNGVGHALAYGPGGIINGKLLNVATNPGLQVKPGQTLALVGGDLNLTGGILRSNGGHLELGAVGRSQDLNNSVTLAPTSTGWQFNYDAVNTMGSLRLDQKAMVTSSGTGTGSIQMNAQKLLIQGRSVVALQNTGHLPIGDLRVYARESVEMLGTTSIDVTNLILSDALGDGTGGNISVVTPRFFMGQGGGTVTARNFGSGQGGNITMATTQVELMGETSAGIISSRVIGSGKGGNIILNTQYLRSQNGGGVFANVNGGSGQGGNVLINATESIELTRPNPKSERNQLGSSTVTGKGNAGNIDLNTPRLKVLDGSMISTSTFGVGNAGKITVNAESVEIAGIYSGFSIPESAAIRSAAIQLDLVSRRLFGLAERPTGQSGSVTINAKTINLRDRGQITVRNDGTNQGGQLRVNADLVTLKQGGNITASTISGQGGEIRLNLGTALLMRYGSYISATAGGQGNGGNVFITAPIILGLENSDIIANAQGGKGGNITLTTQDIIGLKFRNTLTPRQDLTNDITASSEFNISGTVDVKNLGLDPSSGLAALPVDIVDSSQKVDKGCAAAQGNSFISTGRGGIPDNPARKIMVDRSWKDTRTPISSQRIPIAQSQIPKPKAQIVEASHLQIDRDGSIALTHGSVPDFPVIASCAHGSSPLD